MDVLHHIVDRVLAKSTEDTESVITDAFRELKNYDLLNRELIRQRDMFSDFFIQMATVFETQYKEKHGRDFDEVSEEDRAKLARMLALAVFEIASEMDPGRLKMIAAAVASLPFAQVDTEGNRAAAWRVIKQLAPESIRLLVDYCRDDCGDSQEYECIQLKSIPHLSRDEKRDLEDDGYRDSLSGWGCIVTTSQLYSVRYDIKPTGGERVVEDERPTALGWTVVTILLPYIVDEFSSRGENGSEHVEG